MDSAARVAQRFHEAVIRKEKGQFCVRSPNNPDWNGGCYDSKGEAEKRLQQVEYFKKQASKAKAQMEAVDRFLKDLPDSRSAYFMRTIRYVLEDGAEPSLGELRVVREILKDHGRPDSEIRLFMP